jgi:hypothetical protein
MIRSGLRLKVLSLCAMALSLMAFSAGAAQAETGANWMLNGSNVTSGLLPGVDLFSFPLLRTQIAGAGVEYECSGAKLLGTKLETAGKLTSGGKAKATGCVTYLNGSLSTICVPRSAGLANGEIETLALKGLMELSAGEPVAKISPKEGETYVVIRHGEECSLPEQVPVKGKLVIEDIFNQGDVELTSHTIGEESFLSQMYVISNTFEHAATLSGLTSASLSGAHSGLKWSGLPG